ncbi:cytoplasmic protein [Ephemerocybe angulata]|uniref:Cytoplasmic protein n=1 Tax=Ephemerocybe angulata TaxID=980116 RepID=A0A8H6I3Y7_9AGAR|nr:cytoplasmic protein [Tulosesus angulatus]
MNTLDLFPPQTPAYILAFQFSSWYPTFSDASIKSTIIRPLSGEFKEYLESDSVFVPVGSEDVPPESTLLDDEDEDEEAGPSYAFPELDTKIRECVQEYGAVFPKLNFTSPRDASWLLPAGSPLKCTTPADVYMLLKSSDFVSNDLSEESVFEHCDDPDPHASGGSPPPPEYALELVLRKWYSVNPSREMRCFVRAGRLVGISQRDTNHYDFLMEAGDARQDCANQSKNSGKIKSCQDGKADKTVSAHTQTSFTHPTHTFLPDIFDFLLTRDLSRGHIIDFNPYSPRTDSLLFSFEELRELAQSDPSKSTALPEFRYIDSPAHPAASRNAPIHQHNMVPFEALQDEQWAAHRRVRGNVEERGTRSD